MTKETTKPGFERFWDAYRYKVGRDAAMKAWIKNKLEEFADDIIAAIPAYDQHLSENPWKHKAHASTWLNGKRWQDEFTTSKPVFVPKTPEERERERQEYIRGAIQANDWDRKPSANNRVNDLIKMAVSK